LKAGCEQTRDAHRRVYRSIIFVRTGAIKKIQVEEIEYVAGRPCRILPLGGIRAGDAFRRP